MSVLLKFRYEGLLLEINITLFFYFFATYPPWCKHCEYK